MYRNVTILHTSKNIKMLQSIAKTINTIGLRLIRFYLQLYTPRLPISITISSVCITRVIIVARHCNFLYNHESFDTRHFSLSHIDNNISIGMGRGH